MVSGVLYGVCPFRHMSALTSSCDNIITERDSQSPFVVKNVINIRIVKLSPVQIQSDVRYVRA